MEKNEYGLIVFSLLGVIIAIILYPLMPETMVSHWDVNGNPDGYMPKNLALFLFPAIIIGITLLLVLLPRIDPKKKNYEFFKTQYYVVILVFQLFLYLLFAMFVLWNLGHKISIPLVLGIGFGILFIALGSLLKNAKQNWFVGIRTPWTLESEEVWDKTHKLGSVLFYLAGIIILFSSFISAIALFFAIIVTVLIIVIVLFVYSYLEFNKLEKQTS